MIRIVFFMPQLSIQSIHQRCFLTVHTGVGLLSPLHFYINCNTFYGDLCTFIFCYTSVLWNPTNLIFYTVFYIVINSHYIQVTTLELQAYDFMLCNIHFESEKKAIIQVVIFIAEIFNYCFDCTESVCLSSQTMLFHYYIMNLMMPMHCLAL